MVNVSLDKSRADCMASCMLVDLDEAYDDFMYTKASKSDDGIKGAQLKKASNYFEKVAASGYRSLLLSSKRAVGRPGLLETSDSSSDSEGSDTPAEKSRQVSFADVSVREYAPTVADSPNSAMYPIGLGWKHSETVTLNLQDFENRLSSSSKNPFVGTIRGFRRPQKLTTADRFTRLANFSGLSAEELYELELNRSLRNKKSRKTDDSATSRIKPKRYQRVDLDHYARVAV